MLCMQHGVRIYLFVDCQVVREEGQRKRGKVGRPRTTILRFSFFNSSTAVMYLVANDGSVCMLSGR